jgi:transposase
VEKWFTEVAPARVVMEAGTHSIWISEQLQELGHEVIAAKVRESRVISHSDRKSDQVDAEKLARHARLDPKTLRPIAHRTLQQQQALTLIRARDLFVRLRTAAVNAVRGLTSPAAIACRLPRHNVLPSAAWLPCQQEWPRRSSRFQQIAEMTIKIKQNDRQIRQLALTEYPETQALLRSMG